MKKALILLSLSSLGLSYAAADPLTPLEAWQRVASTSSSLHKAKAFKHSTPQVCAELPGVYYVFGGREGEGFVLAGADSRMRPLLGYSPTAGWDEAEMPPQLKWWLEGYRDELAACCAQPTAPTPAVKTRPAIEPLLTTKWDQLEPYWDMCPVYGDRHCVTGCVATAMAQIVNYHKYFEGSGSKTLAGSDLTIDYSDMSIDFSQMADVYDESSTEAQKQAVARLMLACGVAVNMNYGGYVSGAMSSDVPAALSDYMGYAKGATYQQPREGLVTAEWEQLVYDELAAGRPVYYSGTALSGGHAFVCDGYDGEGLFHFNWGWSGSSDGYYALSALNPAEQGTGSYEGGYNYNQAVVLVRRPNCEIEEEKFVMNAGISISGNTWTFRFTPSIVTVPVHAALGYRIEDEDGHILAQEQLGSFDYKQLATKTCQAKADICSAAGVAGVYLVRPVFHTGDGTWQTVEALPRYAEALKVKMDAGTVVSLEECFPDYALSLAADFGVVSLVADEPMLSLHISNDGDNEYNQPSGIGFYAEGATAPYRSDLSGWQNGSRLFTHSMVVPAHGYTPVRLPLKNLDLPAGHYDICLLNARKLPVTPMHGIELTDEPLDVAEVNKDATAERWYSIDGRVLPGRPLRPGIYLRTTAAGTRKVVISTL